VVPPPVPHSDFRTPEYVRFDTIQARKWEATRGMSHSFGFNRNDAEEDYDSAESLLSEVIDCVSKGGNMLLNIGPRGDDAQIPEPQLQRLAMIGAWLKANGQAIYGARPWRIADGETADGTAVRFTLANGRLNIIVLGAPRGDELMIRDLGVGGAGARLADGCPVELTPVGRDLSLRFARPLDGAFGPVVCVEGV
jgi:alpha-L-fucosidase